MKKLLWVIGLTALVLLVVLCIPQMFGREDILPETIMVDGSTYHMRGEKVDDASSVEILGTASVVPQDEMPAENGQSNIPAAKEYGFLNGKVVICIAGEWYYCSLMPTE